MCGWMNGYWRRDTGAQTNDGRRHITFFIPARKVYDDEIKRGIGFFIPFYTFYTGLKLHLI